MVTKLAMFEKEQPTVDIIKGYLDGVSEVEFTQAFEDYSEGFKFVCENKIPVVLFSVIPKKDASLKWIRKLCDQGIKVIALSEDFSVSNVIKILRSGAKDFVSKPVLKKEFLLTVKKCCKDNIKTIDKCQTISVFSNKGGVGKTAIATNLAFELAKLTREKVLLLDLNFPIGDVITFLDIKPIVGLSGVVSPKKTDTEVSLVDACRQYKNSTLYVLADPVDLDETKQLSIEQFNLLLKKLKEEFSFIIIDMGLNVDKFNINVLQQSNSVLLVTIVNLPLIRNCQRCLDLFKNLEFPESKIKVVLNRYLEDEITMDDIKSVLKKDVYWYVPNNYYTVMSSINKAIPLSEVNEHSNITESITKLASKLTDELFESLSKTI